MNQGIVVAILSFLLYLANLFGGGAGQPIQSMDPPQQQQSYHVLGLSGTILADSITLRHAPSSEANPLGIVHKDTNVTILDESEQWYKIRSGIGTEGWIPGYAVRVNKNNPKQDQQMVLGYYPGGEMGYESLIKNGPKLTGIAPLGWKLDSYGGLQANFDPEEMGRSLHFAGNQELETYAHLRVDASPSRVISNIQLQTKSIEQLTSTLQEWGLKGVLVDLNYLPGSEQAELFAFLETLGVSLDKQGLKTIVSLPWDASLDYEAASAAAEYVVLKGQQGQATTPQPLAPLPDMRSMLQAAVELIPAEKIILALNTSGLDWPRSGLPTALSHRQVLDLAARHGANVRWDADSSSPFFQYGGNEVWFENRYSLKYKLELAREFQLGGIALLDLGQEDPEIWPSINQMLVSK